MLFHCAPNQLDVLLPLSDYLTADGATVPVLYASHDLRYALPFGLTFQFQPPGGYWHLACRNGLLRIQVHNGHVIQTSHCWVYTMEERHFKKINDFEWISQQAITEFDTVCIPADVVWHYILTSTGHSAELGKDVGSW